MSSILFLASPGTKVTYLDSFLDPFAGAFSFCFLSFINVDYNIYTSVDKL